MALADTLVNWLLRAVVWVTTGSYRLQFQAVYLFRRFVIPKRPDAADHVIVEEARPAELRRVFQAAGLLDGGYASYYYYGEDLNMVEGVYRDDNYEWYQYHVRGFAIEEGTRLRPHVELFWRRYPGEHIAETNLSEEAGIERTTAILDAADTEFQYRVVNVEPAG